MTRRRRLRAVPPPPGGPVRPAWDAPEARPTWIEPPSPTLGLLRGRATADVEGLVARIVRALKAEGASPALLWCEAAEGLSPGSASVASSAVLLPEALRAVALSEAVPAVRVAYVAPGGLRRAAEGLLRDLGAATHLLIDGRLLGFVRAHVSVLVAGDAVGDLLPEAVARRELCDMEIDAPGDAFALGLLRALARRTT